MKLSYWSKSKDPLDFVGSALPGEHPLDQNQTDGIPTNRLKIISVEIYESASKH